MMEINLQIPFTLIKIYLNNRAIRQHNTIFFPKKVTHCKKNVQHAVADSSLIS